MGKPKLFFIEACRGSTPDFGSLHQEQALINLNRNNSNQDCSSSGQNISIMSDIGVIFSCADGFPALYNNFGSWFTLTLCEALEEYAKMKEDIDLIKILTCVNRFISTSKEVDYPTDEKLHHHKQMPVIMSMLTKTFYFNRIIL